MMYHHLLHLTIWFLHLFSLLHVVHSTSLAQSLQGGGKEAIPHSIPYQVGLTVAFSKMIFCGGSLISRRFVLTAGHCTYNRMAEQIQVVVGEHDFVLDGDEQDRHAVESIIQHPNYIHGSSNWNCDFALLKLANPVALSRKVGIIKLPDSPHMTFERQTLIISGWGQLRAEWGVERSGGSVYLKYGKLQGVPRDECKATFPEINENNLCARDLSQVDMSCYGDSGGPLAYTNDDGQTFLVGVTSYGNPGCPPSQPSVFARVTKHLKWIQENTDVKSVCNCDKKTPASTILFKSNDTLARLKYDGDAEGKIPWGIGTMYFRDGSQYTGEWVNGSRHGKGKQIYPEGSARFSYDGDWVLDKWSGKGILVWRYGDMYEGQFQDNKMSGTGIYTKADGSVYEGEFSDNKISGQGVYIMADGSVYEGQFLDNKMSGQGVYVLADGRRYEGQFRAGKPHGVGTYFDHEYSQLGSFVGNFENGKPSGAGYLYWKNGQVTIGYYHNFNI